MFEDRFEGKLENLEKHILDRVQSPDIRLIGTYHTPDRQVCFTFLNVTNRPKITAWFNFEKGYGGYGLAMEFEKCFSFAADFRQFYIEPNRTVGRKEARMHRFRSITTE